MSLFQIDIPSLTASAVFTKGQNQITTTVSVSAFQAVTLPQLSPTRANPPPSLDYRLVGTIKQNSTIQGGQILTVSRTEPWTDLTVAGIPTITKVGIFVLGQGDTGSDGKSIPVPLTIVDPAAVTTKPVVTPTPNPVVTPTPNPTPSTNGTASTPATNTGATQPQSTIPKAQPIPDFPPPGGNFLVPINTVLSNNQFVRITAPASASTSVEGSVDEGSLLSVWRAGTLNAQTSYWDLVLASGAKNNQQFTVVTQPTVGTRTKNIQPYIISVPKTVGV